MTAFMVASPLKCAADAAPHTRFSAERCGRGGIHAFKRCPREWFSPPLCQAFFGGGFGAAL